MGVPPSCVRTGDSTRAAVPPDIAVFTVSFCMPARSGGGASVDSDGEDAEVDVVVTVDADGEGDSTDFD